MCFKSIVRPGISITSREIVINNRKYDVEHTFWCVVLNMEDSDVRNGIVMDTTEKLFVLRPRKNLSKLSLLEPTCSSSEKKKAMTGKERSRKYRKKLKEDKELYDAHRKYDNARVAAYIQSMPDEKKKEYNEKTRLRMQAYRERKKGQLISTTIKPKKAVTRAEKEHQKAKWCEAKRKQRQSMTAQKRRRINEKRRENYANKKQKIRQEMRTKQKITEKKQQTTTESGFRSDDARRKAVSRMKTILPSSPRKFSTLLSSIIEKATPSKKSALRKRLICSPNSKKRLELFDNSFGDIKRKMEGIKKSKLKKNIVFKRTVAHLLSRSAIKTVRRNEKNILDQFGISRKLAKSSVIDNFDNLDARKKRKDALSEVELEKVDNFFKRPDFVRTLPSTSLIGKDVNKVKHVMECSLKRMHEEYTSENPEKPISYSKFIKQKPRNVLPMSKNKFMNCLCEYCVNMELCVDALRSFTQHRQIIADRNEIVDEERIQNNEIPELLAIRDKYQLSSWTLCPKQNLNYRKQCFDRKCVQCGTSQLNEKLVFLEDYSNDNIKWSAWERTKYKNAAGKESLRMMKIPKEEKFNNFLSILKVKLEPFAKHIFNAKWQAQQFKKITMAVPENWVVMCLDFAENFTCLWQDEAQGAHWSYDQVTIHPIVSYYNCPKENCTNIVEESIMFISDDHKHDNHAVQHYLKTAVNHLLAKGIEIEKLIQFSDGASSQYKGKVNFADLSYSYQDLGFQSEKHFFGSRHGKGPCDREIGTVKKSVVLAVKSRSTEVSDAKTFYDYCNKALTRPKEEDEHVHFKRKCIYVTCGQIERNRPERQSLKAVKGTRTYHSFRCIQEGVVTHRERSCFCESCITSQGKCENEDLLGKWIVSNLKKRVVQRRNVRARTAEINNMEEDGHSEDDRMDDQEEGRADEVDEDGQIEERADEVYEDDQIEGRADEADEEGQIKERADEVDEDGQIEGRADEADEEGQIEGRADEDGQIEGRGDEVDEDGQIEGRADEVDEDGQIEERADEKGQVEEDDQIEGRASKESQVDEDGQIEENERSTESEDDMTLLNDSTMEMINADINQISFEYDDLLETVTMDQKINEDHAKYQVGEYIVIKHGASLIPGVVDDWPWVRFFCKAKNMWTLNDTRHTILHTDVHSKITSPDIVMCGSRILYKFSEKF